MKTAGLLLLAVMWEGILCQKKSDFVVTANKSVTVQEGLCVLIPCNFTFKATEILGNYAGGFWFIEGANIDIDNPVASNKYWLVSEKTRGRFKLVGDIWNRDCTLRIDDAMKKDHGKYFFRIKGESFSYSYKMKSSTEPFVNVTDLWEHPELCPSAELVAGTPVNITCTAPGRCSGTPPRITWTGTLNTAHSTRNTQSMNRDGTVTHASMISFIPSIGDQNKTLTCKVYYPVVEQSTNTTLSLNVQYPPGTPEISVIVFDGEGSSMEFQNQTSVEVQERSSLKLLCSVDSNPPSNVTWRRQDSVIGPEATRNNTLELTISQIHTNENGKYWCVATNEHNTSESHVNIIVEFGPRSGDGNNATCNSDPHQTKCSCVIQSNPPPVMWWLINKELVTGNYSNGTLNVSSITHGHTGTSTLTLYDSESSRSQIACISSNKHGAIFVGLTQSPENKETKPLSSVMIQGGLGGAAIMAVVILMILLLAFGVRKMRKGNKSAVGEERIMNEDNLIYAVVEDNRIQSPSEAAEKTAATSPTAMNSSVNAPRQVNENGDEFLYYANIDFSKLNPRSRPPAQHTEYSEVKLK
ncbi:sialic acid-binding Ig-like lectin 13 [Microcaecilia unicolor]|uniref:Sialic acid-binding Ig-like lectin 13 n=1 Tax=Microcaecilia unicolor TaxID=1415580 RepID=A0A6P7YV13_9AMPH|nr:sialic acid-binding Ig-like lectin 13 [Microcaecilia unicolor]